MKTIIIKTKNLNETAPLYCRFSHQGEPQPGFIEVDPRGEDITVEADYSHEPGGGIPADVWHHLVERISCPSWVLGSDLIEYMQSEEFKTKILALCEGYGIDWDGSNYIGRWNQWSDDHIREIESDLQSLEMVQSYEGAEWIEGDVYFFNADGSCDEDEATSAVYGDSPETGIEITRGNLDALVKDAESYLDYNQVVDGIEEAFFEIIENLEDHQK